VTVPARIRHRIVLALCRLGPSLALVACIGLSACGLSAEQRSAAITFGRALDDHGQLLVEESTYIRSEVKAMRVLAMSLPNSQSAGLFNQGAYENLAAGVETPKIERLVQIGGAASKFGNSVAQVADLTSSSSSEQKLSAATRQLALTAGAISEAAGGASMGGSAAVNLITFISLEEYRKQYLTHALPDAEPAVRKARETSVAHSIQETRIRCSEYFRRRPISWQRCWRHRKVPRTQGRSRQSIASSSRTVGGWWRAIAITSST
jgi:hypothetical protein